MNPSHPVARRGSALAANLGLSERVFASSADRAMAKAIDDGIERVEAGLLHEVSFADSIGVIFGFFFEPGSFGAVGVYSAKNIPDDAVGNVGRLIVSLEKPRRLGFSSSR